MAPVKKELSAFERKRLQNITTNTAILTDIAKDSVKIAPSPKPPNPAPSRKRPSGGLKRESVAPTRQSSRLAGLTADNETLKRKLEVKVEVQAVKEKAKRTRITEDLALGDIAVEGTRWGGGLGALTGLVRGAQPGVRTFGDEDLPETTDGGLKDLQKRMKGLALYEGWSPADIKITPQRIYSLGFHPTEDKPVIFAGDKEGAMGVFDASQEGPSTKAADGIDYEDENVETTRPIISVFKTHARTISSFAFSVDANAVYSASYDSSIRKVDLEKGVSMQVYAPVDASEEQPISALEIPSGDAHTLYFSTLDGTLGRHDLRAGRGPVGGGGGGSTELFALSEQKIGGFSLHPLRPHLLATASLDRTLRIWDLRKLNGNPKLPSLLGSHESRLSVSHASWSTAGHVATSSYDDTIKIHNFGTNVAAPATAGTFDASWPPGQVLSDRDMEPVVRIRHNNQTGRWVTILKPQWQRAPPDGIQKLVVGNMNRFVDVYASDGTELAQLGGDGISAVPAVAQFHPTKEWVAGGTASGKLCLWT